MNVKRWIDRLTLNVVLETPRVRESERAQTIGKSDGEQTRVFYGLSQKCCPTLSRLLGDIQNEMVMIKSLLIGIYNI